MNKNISLALQISFDLLQHAMNLQALLGKAASENRDITDDELAALSDAGAIAGSRLDAAIKEAEEVTNSLQRQNFEGYLPTQS